MRGLFSLDKNFKPMPLRDWLAANQPKEEMLWKQGFWDQALFVRDRLYSLWFNELYLGNTFNDKFREFDKWLRREAITVISTHRSKSIDLPVYYFNTMQGVQFIMRDNFHDWGITVIADHDLYINSEFIFNKETNEESYYEGFLNSWIKECYQDNKKEFSLATDGHYQVYCLMMDIKRRLVFDRKQLERDEHIRSTRIHIRELEAEFRKG